MAEQEAPQISEGQITEEALERLRSRLGSYNRPSFYGLGPLHEEVTRDSIRHFVRGIGDPNPLWVDTEYAASTRWGGLIAPPTFLYSVYWTSGRTGGLPGVHGFHAGNDWVWHRPIMLGDRITVQEQFTGLEERQGEFAGRTMIQSSISTYRNQRGEVIAECKGWQFRAERRAARERGKYQREPHVYTEDEIFAIEEEMLNEEIRGANPSLLGRRRRSATRCPPWSRGHSASATSPPSRQAASAAWRMFSPSASRAATRPSGTATRTRARSRR